MFWVWQIPFRARISNYKFCILIQELLIEGLNHLYNLR